MHVTLQTWFSFEIQIYINGRAHLAKMLDKENIGYKRYDNCFLQIDNLERAQELPTTPVAPSRLVPSIALKSLVYCILKTPQTRMEQWPGGFLPFHCSSNRYD